MRPLSLGLSHVPFRCVFFSNAESSEESEEELGVNMPLTESEWYVVDSIVLCVEFVTVGEVTGVGDVFDADVPSCFSYFLGESSWDRVN